MLLCADFSTYPDNTQLGPAFTLSSMNFQDVPGSITSFVNVTNGQLGLQFPESGLDITLPTLVAWAGFKIGHFSGDFSVEALDFGGQVINSYKMNLPNTYLQHQFTQANPDIAALRLQGGGNEGVLVSLCILV